MEWRDLAQRQRRVFAAGDDRMKLESASADLVLAGAIGKPQKASCLEALLFLEQARRYPMIAHPTEMNAFILRPPGASRGVRVYWSGSDFVGAKMRDEVTSRIAADLAAGYVLLAHLHNHPFLFDRVIGDRMWTTVQTKDDIAGAIVPSGADIQLYRDFHQSSALREAWVTNGFDSMHFDAAEFSRFVVAEKR